MAHSFLLRNLIKGRKRSKQPLTNSLLNCASVVKTIKRCCESRGHGGQAYAGGSEQRGRKALARDLRHKLVSSFVFIRNGVEQFHLDVLPRALYITFPIFRLCDTIGNKFMR